MKKLSLILGVVALLAFSSCAKERECKCVVSSTGSPDMETTMTVKGKCSDGDGTVSANGTTVKTTCTEL